MDVKEHNKIILSTLKKGDRVRFDRGTYSHWGIYVGAEDKAEDKNIIHVTGINGDLRRDIQPKHFFTICGKQFEKVVVTKDGFMKVAGEDKAYRDNSLDIYYSPKQPDEIIKTAQDLIGEYGFNLLTKNCEHFASLCRYGVGTSCQAKEAQSAITDSLGIAAVAICVFSCLLLGILHK